MTPADSRFKSLVKAINYRIYTTVLTVPIAYIGTVLAGSPPHDRLALSLWVAGLEFAIKTGSYYVYERLCASAPYHAFMDQLEQRYGERITPWYSRLVLRLHRAHISSFDR